MVTRRSAMLLMGSVPASFALPVLATEQVFGAGIIMVGASWCPFCKGASEQLYFAAKEWGWPVLVASTDDRPIPPFEHFIPSQGHPLTREVERLPTTLVVAPSRNEILASFEGYTGPAPFLGQIATVLTSSMEMKHG